MNEPLLVGVECSAENYREGRLGLKSWVLSLAFIRIWTLGYGPSPQGIMGQGLPGTSKICGVDIHD